MIYGFDFGTSNSSISINEDGKVELVNLEETSTPTVMPSLLYFDPDESEWSFGERALREYHENFGEGRLIQNIKKFLDDPSFKRTQIGDRFFTLVDLISMFFKQVKIRADFWAGDIVENVRIGIPIRISRTGDINVAKGRIEAAAHRIGWKNVGFMYEPIAATFGLKDYIERPVTVFALDIGGGTSDTSVVYLDPDKSGQSKDEILAYDGIGVGGTDVTSEVMKNHLLDYFGRDTMYRDQFGKETQFPVHYLHKAIKWDRVSGLQRDNKFHRFISEVEGTTSDPEKIRALKQLVFEHQGLDIYQATERCKIALSESESAKVAYHESDINIDEPVTRAEFEGDIRPIYAKLSSLVDRTLGSAGVQSTDIDLVMLIGGSIKVPLFQALVDEKFPGKEVYMAGAQTSVAYGLGAVGEL